MSGTPGLSSFVLGDYLIFALMLLVSAAVGVYYAWKDRDQRTSGDFLMGGKKLTALPVAMSLTASFMSAITVLSTPAEVYRFGAIIAFSGLSYVLAMIATSEIFLPVFYRLGITSTYEYLELRFNRATRLLGTVLFIVQTVLYTGIVIYTPALALTQVTGIDLWGAIVSTGLVCTFYCTMGGLKAVVWTDVFQVGVMLAGFLAVIVQSVILQGGIFPIIKDSQDGGRLNFWEYADYNHYIVYQPGPSSTIHLLQKPHSCQTVRYYFALHFISDLISEYSYLCFSRSLYINLCGLWCIMLCSVFAGLCLYSIYKSCDPWTSGLISAPDQLMPYLVMDILRGYPGLPGLFVAAAYSGSLSTVSSSINALAAVTVEDLIKPYTNLSEKQLWASFFVRCTYYLVNKQMLCFDQHLFQGAISGLVLGLMLSLWVAIGSQLYPPPPELTCPLPLITKGCNFTNMDIHNWTSTILLTEATTPIQHLNSRSVLDKWYSLSYVYFSPIGTITVVCVGLLVSFFSGKDNFNIFQISEFQMTILTSYATTKQGSLYINNKHDRA
uniref:Solute carrier family 5 member 8 n=1 Tax=Neogobius melanostomus TaxID=47308 RepID=A0A8C6WRE1_9GOBI